jgi:preprotein translocase subunit SecY
MFRETVEFRWLKVSAVSAVLHCNCHCEGVLCSAVKNDWHIAHSQEKVHKVTISLTQGACSSHHMLYLHLMFCMCVIMHCIAFACDVQAQADEVADHLKQGGVSASAYHAGKHMEERLTVQVCRGIAIKPSVILRCVTRCALLCVSMCASSMPYSPEVLKKLKVVTFDPWTHARG